jgi:hypothetical protein
VIVNWTKLVILAPSIAIKQGTLTTFDAFKKPLAGRYGFTPACFEHDSGKLTSQPEFTKNEVFLAKDAFKKSLICLETIRRWNLKYNLGEKLKAF